VAGANGPADVITGPKTTTYDVNGLQAGTYYFKCDIHPGMNGQLKVS
jgi:plastocyanin